MPICSALAGPFSDALADCAAEACGAAVGSTVSLAIETPGFRLLRTCNQVYQRLWGDVKGALAPVGGQAGRPAPDALDVLAERVIDAHAGRGARLALAGREGGGAAQDRLGHVPAGAADDDVRT